MYKQLLILFLIMVTGYILRKAGILNEAVNLGINRMIVLFGFPCLIVYRLGTMKVTAALAKDFFVVCILGGVSFVLFTVIGHLYYKVRGLTDRISAPAMLCTFMPNNGFIGYPVALVFMGDTGLILMIAHGAIVFNIYTYTYAITYLRRSNTSSKAPWSLGRIVTMFFQVILNPNVLAIIAGMIIFAFGISLDNIAGDYLSTIGDMVSPLVMIYIGSMLAGNDFLDMFKNKLAWEAASVKLILIPAIFFLLTLWLPVSDTAKAILILGVSFPSAAIPIMLGEQLGIDTKQAGNIFFLSTLLSIVTLPAVMFILEKILVL